MEIILSIVSRRKHVASFNSAGYVVGEQRQSFNLDSSQRIILSVYLPTTIFLSWNKNVMSKPAMSYSIMIMMSILMRTYTTSADRAFQI